MDNKTSQQFGLEFGHDEDSPDRGPVYANQGMPIAQGPQGAPYQQRVLRYAPKPGMPQQGYAQQRAPYAPAQQGMPQGYPGMHQAAPQGAYAGQHPASQPPAPAVPEHPKKKRKRGGGFWVALIIALAALTAAGVFAFLWFQDQQPKPTRAEAALEGQLEGKSPAEVQAELNRIVEDGMLSISIASVVSFPDGQSEGELRIENSPANKYLLDVDITRNDTGDVVYESGIFAPDTHIQKDKLDVDLPKGTYECTALFHALDPETEEEIGQAAAEVLIIVGA